MVVASGDGAFRYEGMPGDGVGRRSYGGHGGLDDAGDMPSSPPALHNGVNSLFGIDGALDDLGGGLGGTFGPRPPGAPASLALLPFRRLPRGL